MSGRIVCLALAAAALIITPTSAAQQSRAGASRHISHHTTHHRHGLHHRQGLHHRHGWHHRHGLHHRQGLHGRHKLHGRVDSFAWIAEPAIIDVPFASHAGPAVAIANPWPLFDPSWKFCQLDPSLDGRPDLCGPYSYYPFGPYGYRPYGTYRPYADRAAPGSPIVPSARVIRIERDD